MLRLLVALLVLPLAACSAYQHAGAVVVQPPPHERAKELQEQVAAITRDVPVDAFEADTFISADGRLLRYRLLKPQAHAGGRRLPLVVIFHGSGAIGDDNRSQIGPLAKSWATNTMQRKAPALVLVPQFPERSANYQVAADSLPYSEGTPYLAAAIELIRHIQEREQISYARTYAIGFSMGGSAIWNALEEAPRLFARAVIVAGVPSADALRVAGFTRLLLVHGDKDEENPFAATWRVFGSRRRGTTFWRYSGLGHEFPPDLIVTDKLARWLFEGDSTVEQRD